MPNKRETAGRDKDRAASAAEAPTVRYQPERPPASSPDSGEFDRRETGEFDGTRTDEYEAAATVIEGPPRSMERPRDTGPDPQTELDPEDKETELWARAAESLFPHGRPAAGAEASQPLTPVTSPTPAVGVPEAMIVASVRSDPGEPPPVDDVDDEERDTELISGEFVARADEEGSGQVETGSDPEQQVPLLSDSVEVSGAEGEAARQLVIERRSRDPANDSGATLVVDLPKDLPVLDRDCRLCGRRISAPRKARLWRPQSDRGFRCEKCGNDFCAAHVKRVSGLIESLFLGARFRCLLCIPEASPPDRKP